MSTLASLSGTYNEGGELAKLYVLPIQSAEFTHPNSCVAKNTQDCPISFTLDRVLVRYSVKVQEGLSVGYVFNMILLDLEVRFLL